MVRSYTLDLADKDIRARMPAPGAEPELEFFRAGDGRFFVPAQCDPAFRQVFPDAEAEAELADVPVFATFGAYVYASYAPNAALISAQTYARGGAGAVVLGQNCEAQLSQYAPLPGFYQEMGGKNWIIAALSADDSDTVEKVRAIFDGDANLAAFLVEHGFAPEEGEGA